MGCETWGIEMGQSSKVFDVVVAGAGISGSLFGAKLARRGYRVLIIDRDERSDEIKDRMDLVESELLEIAGVDLPVGLDNIPPLCVAELVSPKSAVMFKLDDCAYRIISRKSLISYLRELALEAGAELIFGCGGTGVVVEKGFVTGLNTTKGTYESRIIVDATGAERALVKTMPVGMGFPRRILRRDFVSLYTHAWLSDCRERDEGNSRGEVRYYLSGGGSFSRSIFEENGRRIFGVEIGIRGLEEYEKESDLLPASVACFSKKDEGVLISSSGIVPTRRPLNSMVCNGFMVMGDSACQAMPVFSRGIGAALIGAACAAEAASFALEVKDVSIDALWSYNHLFMKEMGARLAALDSIRTFIQALSDASIEKAFKRGLIGRSFASAILSGKFEGRTFFQLARNVLRSVSDAGFSLMFDASLKRAEKTYRHYIEYPREYDPNVFREWSRTADSMFEVP